MFDLTGKTALVTGATGGIGGAIAKALHAQGATVALSGTRREVLDALAAEMGERTHVLPCDLSNIEQVEQLVPQAEEAMGELDILVNNAGITRYVPLADLDGLTDEIWDLAFDTNLRGTFYCCRAAAPHLKRTEGAIVNVASMAGVRGAGSSVAYAVSKAGVIHLTKVLAVALAPAIRVNCVVPGFVQTRWMERGVGKEASAREAERVGGETPLGRVAMPEDVGETIANLLWSRFVTGQDIVIDGGKSLKYD